MIDYARFIVDGRPGTRCDVTPLFADGEAFSTLVGDLSERAAHFEYDLVAGIDALGFILGAAIAAHTGKGFVAIRKGGKLPVDADRAEFVDYTGTAKSLELRLAAFPPGSRVLLVDEWIETGAQVRASIALISRQGGSVAAIACVNCDDSPATAGLRAGLVILQAIPATAGD